MAKPVKRRWSVETKGRMISETLVPAVSVNEVVTVQLGAATPGGSGCRIGHRVAGLSDNGTSGIGRHQSAPHDLLHPPDGDVAAVEVAGHRFGDDVVITARKVLARDGNAKESAPVKKPARKKKQVEED